MISLEPLNLVIRYDRKQYQVKYISDDVTLYDELHKFGKILNPLNAPVKEGYEFVDWSLSPTVQIDYDFDQPLESHVILYARWAFIDGVSYEGYYEGADGLSGSSLRTFLNQRVNQGFNRVSYATATTALQVSDRDPNNSSNIILVYLGTSVNGTWDSGVTWNREHVWPQSLLGVGTSIGPGTDLHNLKPANPSENSSRGNKYYDVATTSSTYLPRAVVRGDLARILFYMDIAYTNLTLVNSAPNTYQMAKLDVLLRWHLEDPVDDFERNRNDVIYTYQSNRNPFIDHPEFVEKIWGPITLSNQETIQIKFYETFDVIEITVYITDLSVFKKEQDWLM
jgi:endonuclease I